MYRYSGGGEDGEGTRSPPPADVGSRERRAYATVYSHSSSFFTRIRFTRALCLDALIVYLPAFAPRAPPTAR